MPPHPKKALRTGSRPRSQPARRPRSPIDGYPQATWAYPKASPAASSCIALAKPSAACCRASESWPASLPTRLRRSISRAFSSSTTLFPVIQLFKLLRGPLAVGQNFLDGAAVLPLETVDQVQTLLKLMKTVGGCIRCRLDSFGVLVPTRPPGASRRPPTQGSGSTMGSNCSNWERSLDTCPIRSITDSRRSNPSYKAP